MVIELKVLCRISSNEYRLVMFENLTEPNIQILDQNHGSSPSSVLGLLHFQSVDLYSVALINNEMYRLIPMANSIMLILKFGLSVPFLYL